MFVVTSNAIKSETGQPTSFWLSEVTHPLAKFEAANIPVEIASIKGGEAPVEPGYDLNDPVNAHYWNDPETISILLRKGANSMRKAVTFKNGPWEIAAHLYLPEGFQDDQKYPALVGYNGGEKLDRSMR